MLKRLLDVALAVIGLILLAPLLIVLAIFTKLDSSGPIFYRGERIGLGGRPFRICKFRTMRASAEQFGASSTPKDDPRVTRLGRFLRAYKLDELPQLFNVLTGDMSLVGPRPQVKWAVDLYDEQEKVLLSVRPGITDFASIKFSNEGEILQGSMDPDADYLQRIAAEKNRLGLEYVRRQSLRTDFRILAGTLWKLMGGNPDFFLGKETLRVPGEQIRQ